MWVCKANYSKIVKTHTHTCARGYNLIICTMSICVCTHSRSYTQTIDQIRLRCVYFNGNVNVWMCVCLLIFLFAPFLSHFPLCRNHLNILLLANYLTRLYKPLILSFKHENQHQKTHVHCSFFLNYNFFLFGNPCDQFLILS